MLIEIICVCILIVSSIGAFMVWQSNTQTKAAFAESKQEILLLKKELAESAEKNKNYYAEIVSKGQQLEKDVQNHRNDLEKKVEKEIERILQELNKPIDF
jgi:DNA anti-recombination protein RmuC